MENIFDLLFILIYIVPAREEAPWCPFLMDEIRTCFCWNMENMRSVKWEKDGEVLISCQSRHFLLCK